MTIEELALEYGRSAALVRERIKELERAAKEADENERLLLEGRLRPLRILYRETRETAQYLAQYYGSGRGRRR